MQLIRGSYFTLLKRFTVAVYGSGFDSKEYLRRFFDLDYTFKSSECLSWVVSNFNLDPEGPYYFSGVKAKRDPDGYYRDVSMRKKWVFPGLESVVSSDELDLDLPQIFFSALSITFRVSLRGMERNKKHIMASLANIGSKNIHIFFLMYLVFLKNADDELYSCFVRSDMRSGDLAKEIKQKYAPRKVYFPFANVDVHSLAVVYRDLVFAFKWEDGKEAPQSKYELVEQVFIDRRESVNSLNYDRVIGLASRID